MIGPNPYREGSKLFDIFRMLADGQPHALADITNRVYMDGTGGNPLYRRRTASAIRTIRKRQGLSVEFNGTQYRLVERN